MTVRELLGRISSRELSEWMAFYRLEPFGDQRADLRQAITTAMLANVNRKRSAKAAEPKDFMPFASDKTRAKGKPMTGALANKMVSRLLPRKKD